MYIDFRKTLKAIERKLTAVDVSNDDLHRAYDNVLRLRSQLLGVIYDREMFGLCSSGAALTEQQTSGLAIGDAVVLTIAEPLPSMKELTPTVQEHWLNLIHTAIVKAARERGLPYFERAFVWIEITTPHGTNNTQLWDTSNRAVNLVINNLKGTFFADDNLEHMAFGVIGKWGEIGTTSVRIMAL